MEEGMDALKHQLNLYVKGKNNSGSSHTTGKETLLEMMRIYAPASDNNTPDKYAQTIANQLGISTSTKIADIDVNKWAAAISSVESPQAYKKLQSLGLV